MEKENMFVNESNWNSSGFGVEIQSNEVNSIFNNPNWGNAMDQSDPFESALSSMVSSPVTSNGEENIVLREVIGTLGSICNSGEISTHIGGNNSANTSCYNTPLNSPPKLNLSMMEHQIRGNLNLSVSAGNNLPAHPSLASFAAEPAFVEMTATFSCFGSGNLVGMNGQIGLNESELPYRLRQRMDIGKLSRVSSNQSIKGAGSLIAGQENRQGSFQDVISTSEKNVENGDSREGSSVSEHIPVGEISIKVHNDANSRKRKTIPRGKAKEIPSSPSVNNVKVGPENEESNAKRSKQDEVNGTEKDDAKANAEGNGNDKTAAGNGNQKQTKDKQKPPETPKEYIHVRARRGEATDSHSLAERVRREKINEKMKFLQDLVPGCNKMTGKAVMLNEIINYVESLQHQVEFLSMKLATVNPRLDLNMETLLSKDILQSSGSLPPNVFPAENWPQAFPYAFQSQQGPNLHSSNPCITDTPFPMNPRNAAIHQKPIMQLPYADGLSEATSQGSKFWVGDLQSVVQMGLGQNQPQNSHVSSTKMKVEQ